MNAQVNTEVPAVKKEFLRIEDMMKKFGVNRKQFWSMRKRGDIPKPVIKSPPTWREKDVDAFYDKRAWHE